MDNIGLPFDPVRRSWSRGAECDEESFLYGKLRDALLSFVSSLAVFLDTSLHFRGFADRGLRRLSARLLTIALIARTFRLLARRKREKVARKPG
jgi:hypothetical protein